MDIFFEGCPPPVYSGYGISSGGFSSQDGTASARNTTITKLHRKPFTLTFGCQPASSADRTDFILQIYNKLLKLEKNAQKTRVRLTLNQQPTGTLNENTTD